MSENETSHFIPRNEVADSIELEISSLPPQEMEGLKSITKQINKKIVSTYKGVIPSEVLERNEDISERVVITNDVGAFAYEWEPEVRGSQTLLDSIRGASFQEGGIVTILNPELAWKKLSSEGRELYIEEEGTAEAAKRKYKQEFLGRLLTHELLHQYQNWNEEQAFLECGVGYYQEQVLHSLQIPYYPSEQRERINEFYASLRNRYGEEVDRLFFGTSQNPAVKVRIMAEMESNNEMLFPAGRGL
jgi:hypothetical protein